MAYKTHHQQPIEGLKNTTAIRAVAPPQEKGGTKDDKSSDITSVIRDNMDPKQAAKYLGLSTSYLTKLRMAGYSRSGPDFVKIGRVIIYRRADLDAWLEANRVTTDVEA